MPLGPSSGRVARYTLGSAPSAAVRNPLWLLKSVAVHPGLAELTLIGVSRSSLAYMTVIMLSAALDEGYCTDGGSCASGCAGSLSPVIEPTSLDTLTIRAAGARRSSGSIDLLPEGSGYSETLRGFGFGDDRTVLDDCTVLVAADEDDKSILGTVTLESFGPASELANDDTEADIRAFAVAAQAQGRGTGRTLLLAVVGLAEKRGLRRLRLCTQPAMQAAQHLYAAAGFSRTPDLDWSPAPGVMLRAYELAIPRVPEP
jgi:ribosomal protein S18 acetylase RimI-like enzyme